MLQSVKTGPSILSADDPNPTEVVNASGKSAFVLTCEHAGRAIPSRLGDLGIDAAKFERHITYDMGAEGLSRRMVALLDALLILQRYSRLVVDCNRPFAARDCFPEISDGTVIPANQHLSEHEWKSRYEEIHQPFHRSIGELLDRREQEQKPAMLLPIHSFTPRSNGKDWLCLVGALFNKDRTLADLFLRAFAAANPGIRVAENEPYRVDNMSDYTIPIHGEARGIPHLLLEIRNDQIGQAGNQARWARLLTDVLTAAAAMIHEKGAIDVR
jgi:predicted N-formylglutamate amidohydrolase